MDKREDSVESGDYVKGHLSSVNSCSLHIPTDGERLSRPPFRRGPRDCSRFGGRLFISPRRALGFSSRAPPVVYGSPPSVSPTEAENVEPATETTGPWTSQRGTPDDSSSQRNIR